MNRHLTIWLLGALSMTAATPAWCDKNPPGNFFGPGGIMPHATEGSGAPVGPVELTTPPPGWTVEKPLLVSPNVRHDLSLNNWTITDQQSGQTAGRWEWDTGAQNFRGTYVNGARDVLRFEEWNDRGRIALSGFNNFRLRVHFTGTQYDTYAEGTATADTQPTPFVWQWCADTGGGGQGALSDAGAAPPPAAAPAPSSPGGAMNVVTASGALQACLGITPGVAKMTPMPETSASCHQLPAADLFDQAGARFKAGDHAGAARILMNAAQAGNPRAQLRLAIMYEAGDGVPRDTKKALSWYARAAASGKPASQTELGGYYEEGDGVPENWDLAAKLYRASASQGWHKGQFAPGRAYEFGIGVPQDRSQAIAWFQRSAAQGNSQGDYYARWLRDSTNNIGFRNEAEHGVVIAGKLRFALGAADPAGITFRNSAERVAWLRDLGSQVNASEAQVMWQLLKDEYDSCMRNGGRDCHSPGPRPGR